METPEADDRQRVSRLIEAGMLPGRAEALVELIRKIEDDTEQIEQADKKAALLQAMTQNGIDRWTAFTVLFTHQPKEATE